MSEEPKAENQPDEDRQERTAKDEISQAELSQVSGGTIFRIPTPTYKKLMGTP